MRHILELTSAYDNILFRYLVRGRVGLEGALGEVIPDPGRGSAEVVAKRAKVGAGHASAPEGELRPPGDAARGWVAYLISERHADSEKAWRWLDERGGVTPALRNQWIDYLVDVRKDYPKAVEAWAAGNAEDSYPGKNRIYNGRFGRELTGGRLNWSLAAHPHVARRVGDGLTLVFDGKENISYGHLSQQTFVPAGRWRFSAEAEFENLTTDQRSSFRIYDTVDARRLDVSTPMAPEGWKVDFSSPPGGSWVTVMLVRRQSEKFDNKIEGQIRLRQVSIRGLNGGT